MTRLLTVLAAAALATSLFAQSPAPSSGNWESVPWGMLPGGLQWEAASQISTTPEGQIVVLRRENPFFVVLTPAGAVVRSWGENLFRVAHGLRIDRKGFLWVTDNADNFVQKYSPDGKLLLTLGQRGVAGGNDSKTAFDGPADAFVMPDGDILVADGYRNSRIVRFASDGTFKGIIGGTKGSEPGQFNIPHAVVVDSRGRVIVADAENSRIQVFDQSGKFLEQWTDFPSKPRGSMFITADDTLYVSHVDSESITIMKNGKVLERVTGIGGRPHGLTLDQQGNLYVANPASRSVKKIVRKAAASAASQQGVQPPPPTPGAFASQEATFKTDSMTFTLAPKEGMEYKYRLAKGAGLLFSWTATAPVHYELHSEPESGPKGYAETFDKQDSRDGAHGNYMAPFSGIHGWYWENRTDREVIVRLNSAGHYTESLEFRRKQDVKRKTFN